MPGILTLTLVIYRLGVSKRTGGGGLNVTKKEIVRIISERSNLTQLKTKEIVQWTFDAIIDALATQGRIELRNFGVFEVRQRKARKARNPRTGESVDVEPKNVVTFQPGKEMEEKVRKTRPVSMKSRTAKTPEPDSLPTVTPPVEAEPVAVGAS